MLFREGMRTTALLTLLLLTACGGSEGALDDSEDALLFAFEQVYLPDLQIEVIGECQTSGELDLLVYNRGNARAERIEIDLYYGPSDRVFASSPQVYETIDALRPGAAVHVNLELRHQPQFRVRLDPRGRVTESLENNNVYFKDCNDPNDPGTTSSFGTAGGANSFSTSGN